MKRIFCILYFSIACASLASGQQLPFDNGLAQKPTLDPAIREQLLAAAAGALKDPKTQYRRLVLNRALLESGVYAAIYQDELDLWTMRAEIALVLNRPHVGWVAGGMINTIIQSQPERQGAGEAQKTLQKLRDAKWFPEEPARNPWRKFEGLWKTLTGQKASVNVYLIQRTSNEAPAIFIKKEKYYGSSGSSDSIPGKSLRYSRSDYVRDQNGNASGYRKEDGDYEIMFSAIRSFPVEKPVSFDDEAVIDVLVVLIRKDEKESEGARSSTYTYYLFFLDSTESYMLVAEEFDTKLFNYDQAMMKMHALDHWNKTAALKGLRMGTIRMD